MKVCSLRSIFDVPYLNIKRQRSKISVFLSLKYYLFNALFNCVDVFVRDRLVEVAEGIVKHRATGERFVPRERKRVSADTVRRVEGVAVDLRDPALKQSLTDIIIFDYRKVTAICRDFFD